MQNERIKIWTDGGTKSNIPPFGNGYGSYRIGESGKIVSEDYGIPMSANAAEILTISKALAASSAEKIEVFSDSRIALNWLKKCANGDDEIPEKISDGMKSAIKVLSGAAHGRDIHASWRPRFQIFRIFGH
jgi:ribonuclease HI